MEERLHQAYLYDFYGELLNEKQRRVFEDYAMNDLTLGEIAETEEISRQAVADMVHRCDKKLAEYEDKLHLVERFLTVRESVERIRRIAREKAAAQDPELLKRMNSIDRISGEILEEL